MTQDVTYFLNGVSLKSNHAEKTNTHINTVRKEVQISNLTKEEGKEIQNAEWSAKMENGMAEKTSINDGMMTNTFLMGKF